MKSGRPLPPQWSDPKGPLRERTERIREQYDLQAREHDRADLVRRRRPYIVAARVGTVLAVLSLLAFTEWRIFQ